MIRIEKVLDIIEQEHKVPLAHLALRVHQVHNASQLGTVEASCDLEDIVISGGAEHFFPRNSHIILFGDFPSTSSNSTWDVQIQFDGTVKQEFYMQNVLIILHWGLKTPFILYFIR